MFGWAVEEVQAILSSQVLQEFYVTATRKLAVPLSAERAAAARVRDFARLPLVLVDEVMICAARDGNRSVSLSF